MNSPGAFFFLFSIMLSPALLALQDPSDGAQLPRTKLVQALIDAAGTTDTEEGVKQYSGQLARMLVDDKVGGRYAASLSQRLTVAELAARRGERKFVPESSVAQAFNELMKRIETGPPPPLSTTALVVHQLRIAIRNTSPALSSMRPDNSDCLPSETVMLLFLLLVNDGKFSVAAAPIGAKSGVSIRQDSPSAGMLLRRYLTLRSRSESANLYDKLFAALGF